MRDDAANRLIETILFPVGASPATPEAIVVSLSVAVARTVVRSDARKTKAVCVVPTVISRPRETHPERGRETE